MARLTLLFVLSAITLSPFQFSFASSCRTAVKRLVAEQSALEIQFSFGPYLFDRYDQSEARTIIRDPNVRAFLAAGGVRTVVVSRLVHGMDRGQYTGTTEVEAFFNVDKNSKGSAIPHYFYVSTRKRPTPDGSHYLVGNSPYAMQ